MLRIPLLRRNPGAVAKRGLCAAVILAALSGSGHAETNPDAACVDAGATAAADSMLPPGLLLAVGRVESGRWDAQQRRVVPWPWVIDVAGQPQFFADKSSAMQATHALLQAGQRNIDVGCFQISLLHHPLAFANLDQAFDPAANAQYAAAFLTSLFRHYGNWADAVAAYHSADPALGTPYRDSVFAAWNSSSNLGLLLAPSIPSVRVWTPGTATAGPQVIHVGGHAAEASAHLPRIITPGH